MANDITGRVWELDTPNGVTPVWRGMVKIKYVEWVTPATTTDTFELTDSNGKSIIKSQAQANLDVQTFNLENWYNGVFLTTLTSGTLRVHLA